MNLVEKGWGIQFNMDIHYVLIEVFPNTGKIQ